jgi:hypothetical protein
MHNRLHFSIEINADLPKIWDALWDESAYRNWASVFYAGSYAKTNNWKEGSKVLFLSPDKSGIYSIIEEHIPNKVMKFKHIGKVINESEQPIDDETMEWTGATEVYTLTKGVESNILTVDIDVLDKHLEFMTEKLPKALERIKNNCS